MMSNFLNQPYRTNTPAVSVIIPAYNEASRLPKTLASLASYQAKNQLNMELIIVVEPSADKTLEIALRWADNQPHVRVINNAVKQGKGFAVKTGMLKASGDIVFFMDADLSVPLEAIDDFIKVFSTNQELMVAIGSRQHPNSYIKLSQSYLRRNMGRIFNVAVQLLSGLTIKDTQCGFKAFRRAVIAPLFQAQFTHGFAFDVEILHRAQNCGFKIIEMPVVWENSPQSHVKIITDSLRMLRDVYHIARRHRETPSDGDNL
jgi:glycosyltransferase involved in cell wall biosynthesis